METPTASAQEEVRVSFTVKAPNFAELANQSVKRRRSVTVPKSLDADPHTRFLLLLRANGLPEPIPEVRFCEGRRWRFDYGFVPPLMPGQPDAHRHVAVEVEGAVWTQGRHTRPAGFLKDVEKYNEAAIRGWVVLRVTPKQLATTATIALIRRALQLTTP